MPMPLILILLAVAAALCITGGIFLVRYLLAHRKPPAEPPVSEPLPGGGGWYTFYVEGLCGTADKLMLESTLQKISDVRAEVHPDTGEVRIRYEGYPTLDFLDVLKQAVENAGFTVKEIE